MRTFDFTPCVFFFFCLAYSQRSQIECLLYEVIFERIKNAGLKYVARGSLKIHDAKITQKIAIGAPSLYLRK